MKIRGSVVSLSSIFTLPPEDEKQKKTSVLAAAAVTHFVFCCYRIYRMDVAHIIARLRLQQDYRRGMDQVRDTLIPS